MAYVSGEYFLNVLNANHNAMIQILRVAIIFLVKKNLQNQKQQKQESPPA